MNYGRGFGFRGSSPAWPYTGRGRGGRPRCMAPGLGRRSNFQQVSTDQEADFLGEESGDLRKRLEEIEARISQLEGKN